MIRKMIGISLALLLTAGLTACGSNLQPEVDRLQAELDAANARIQELAEEAEAEQARIEAEKQRELDALQGKLEDAQTANDELQSRLDELEQAAAELEEQAVAASAPAPSASSGSSEASDGETGGSSTVQQPPATPSATSYTGAPPTPGSHEAKPDGTTPYNGEIIEVDGVRYKYSKFMGWVKSGGGNTIHYGS